MIRKTFFVPALGCILLTAMLLGCGKASKTEVSNERPAVTSDGGSVGEQAASSSTETSKNSDRIGDYYIKDLDVNLDVSSWHRHYLLYTSENGLYGVMSDKGEVITEPKYTEVFDAWNSDLEYDSDYSEIYGVIKGESVEKINPIDKTVTVLDYDDVRGVTGYTFGNSAYLFVNEKEGRWDLYESIGEKHILTTKVGGGQDYTYTEFGAFTDSNGRTYDDLTLIASSEKVHDDLISMGYSEEVASAYPIRYARNSKTKDEYGYYLCFKIGSHDEKTDWLFYRNYENGPKNIEITLPSQINYGSGFSYDSWEPSDVFFVPSPNVTIYEFINDSGRASSKWEFVSNPKFNNLENKKGKTDAFALSRLGKTVYIGEVLGRDYPTVFLPKAYLGNNHYFGWEAEDQDSDGQYDHEGADYIVAGMRDDMYCSFMKAGDDRISYHQKATDKRGNLTCAWNNFFAMENGSGDRYTLYKIYGSEIKKINETPYTSLDISDYYARVGYEDGTYGYVELSDYKEAELAELSERYKFASLPVGFRALVSEDGESFYFISLYDLSILWPGETIEGVEAYELAENTYCIKKADGSYRLLYR